MVVVALEKDEGIQSLPEGGGSGERLGDGRGPWEVSDSQASYCYLIIFLLYVPASLKDSKDPLWVQGLQA